jgi:hypothetical protein
MNKLIGCARKLLGYVRAKTVHLPRNKVVNEPKKGARSGVTSVVMG